MSIYIISISVGFGLGMILLVSLQIKRVGSAMRGLIAAILGIIIGLGCELVLSQGGNLDHIMSLFTLFSQGYIKLLQLLVIPILFLSMIKIIIMLKNSEHGTRIAKITKISMLILFVNTAVSALIGVGTFPLMSRVMMFMWNGGGAYTDILHNADFIYQNKVMLIKSSFDTALDSVSPNLFTVLVSGRAFQIVLLAIIIGLAVVIASRKQSEVISPFIAFIEAAHEVVKELVRLLISVAPYGIFALFIKTLALYGWQSLLSFLGIFVMTCIVGFIILFIWQVLVAFVLGKRNPLYYIVHSLEPLGVAVSTRSSSSTVPVAQKVLQEKFHLHEDTSITIPNLAASAGMNACTGLWPAIVICSTLSALGQSITLLTALCIIAVITISSIAMSRTPGTATMTASVGLGLLGVPFLLLPLAQSTDYFIDMGRTALNVNGGMSTAVVTDRVVAEE